MTLNFEEAYHPFWNHVISEILRWSVDQKGVFLEYYRRVAVEHGEYSMTHDHPLDFVVPYSIPDELWQAVGLEKGRKIEFEIGSIIGMTLNQLSANDWTTARHRVQDLLLSYGYPTPESEVSFRFWLKRKQYGLGYSKTPF